MAYHSKYSGAEVDALLDKIKDDNVGSIDSSLSTTSENPVKNKVITEELNKKVDKVEGKQLSTEDFTSKLKGKLDGLSNYDDTNLKGELEVLKGKVDEKQDYIADLASIRSGANLGSTAIQEHQDISHLLPKSDFETYATKTDSQLTELEDDVEVIAEKKITPNVVEGLAVKSTNLVKADAAKKTFYIQGKAGQSITIYFADITDTTAFYFGFADGIPVAELPITGYKTSSPSNILRELVFPRDCYLLVSCSKANSCYYIGKKTEGIGFDVYNLKQTINESKENAEFSVAGKGIWYKDDGRHKGGSDVIAASNKATSFIKLEKAKSIVFKLYQLERSTFAAIAFYDNDKSYLGGLKGYDGNTEVTINSLEFPSGAFYVRFSTVQVEGQYAIVHYEGNAIEGLKKDIKDINTTFANYDNEFKYWAACGDSITHANHKCMTPLAVDDPYNPIDDYQGRNYDAYIGGNYPNYAYLYCKRHHIKWANYGFGGTIIGSYVPIGETILYPFVEDRITQFKEGIDWNYISLFFGWNDRVHGVQYYREKWLKDTYGIAIKYTTESSKYGTSGYCTEAQKIACDNATELIDGVSYTGYDLFFMKFLGNSNDTTTYTYYGAYNYAVDYLMRKFPKAKIMLITPYIGDVNRMYYQKMRQAIIDVAEKFGIIYFDLGSLPYWYFTNMNNTPFANPDRADGKWYKDSWIPEEPELRLCQPTIEGFHQHLYCYDSVHPTNLGYEMIAEPIGNKLING